MVLKRVVGATTKRKYYLNAKTIELIIVRAARLGKTMSCYISDLVDDEQHNTEEMDDSFMLKRVEGSTVAKECYLNDKTIELITIRAAKLGKTKSCYIADLVDAEQRDAVAAEEERHNA